MSHLHVWHIIAARVQGQKGHEALIEVMRCQCGHIKEVPHFLNRGTQ